VCRSNSATKAAIGPHHHITFKSQGAAFSASASKQDQGVNVDRRGGPALASASSPLSDRLRASPTVTSRGSPMTKPPSDWQSAPRARAGRRSSAVTAQAVGAPVRDPARRAARQKWSISSPARPSPRRSCRSRPVYWAQHLIDRRAALAASCEFATGSPLFAPRG
jgi:hypothetical protein